MKKLFSFTLLAAALSIGATSCDVEKRADYVCTVTQRTSNGVVLETRHTVPLFNATRREKAQFEADNTYVHPQPDGNEISQTTVCE